MDINNTKIIKTSQLGNGLTPRTDVGEGDLLVSVSAPLLILVEKDALEKVCSYCFAEKEPVDLKRCSGCKVPRYCSVFCQKKDWSLIHSKECSIVKKMPGVPPTAVRGLIQLCLRGLDKAGSNIDPAWMELEGHLNGLRQSNRWDEIVLQSTAAVEYSKTPKNWIEWATNLLCRMSTNAFRVTLPDDTPVGLCFCPPLALANHSCSPNAVISFNGRSISLRSLSKIKSGEQIFISYIDPVQDHVSRRAELKERYFFDCECEVCKMDENPYQTFQRTLPARASGENRNIEIWWENSKLKAQAAECESRVKDARKINAFLEAQPSVTRIQNLLEQSRHTNDPTERLTNLKKALKSMQAFLSFRSYAIIPLPIIINELYLHHLDVGSYIEALVILLFLSTHSDPFTYPQPTHPVRVLRLYTIAKLLKHIASLPTDALLPPKTTPFNEDQRHAIRNIDYVSAVQVFLIMTKDLAVKESTLVAGVEADLEDVENIQRERNGGGVGLELKRWMVQGSLAVEGKLLAETVVGGLKQLLSFMGKVVKDLDVGND